MPLMEKITLESVASYVPPILQSIFHIFASVPDPDLTYINILFPLVYSQEVMKP